MISNDIRTKTYMQCVMLRYWDIKKHNKNCNNSDILKASHKTIKILKLKICNGINNKINPI